MKPFYLFKRYFYYFILAYFAFTQTSFGQIENGYWSDQFSGSCNGTIYAIVVRSPTEIYVGGSFTTIGGVPANYIARWDGTSWWSLGSGTNGIVRALAIKTGGGDTLFVGGDFTTAGGSTANHITKWSIGSSVWDPVDGSALWWDPINLVYKPYTFNGLDNSVYSISVSSTTGKVFLGGIFYNPVILSGSWASVTGNKYLISWENGVFVYQGTEWLSGTSVNALAFGSDGTSLYVGGAFVNFSIYSKNYNRIAKLNTTNGTWGYLGNGAAVGDTGVNNPVNCIVTNGTDVYIGGSFFTAGGSNAYRVAKWNGSSWSSLGTGLSNGVNANINAMAFDGSDLYVVGDFTHIGNNFTPPPTANYIARWNVNSSSWFTLGAGLNFSGSAVGISGQNIYVGGSFTQSGGYFTSNSFARYYPISNTISGTVTYNGSGQSGTTVSLSGPYSTTSPTTTASGTYSFQVGNFGTYTITPSQANYEYTLGSLQFSNVTTAQTAQTFTALGTIRTMYHSSNMSGTVTTTLSPFTVTISDQNGVPIPNQSVTFAITSTPGGATGQRLNNNLLTYSTTTDVIGQASTTLTLGTKTGSYSVRATSSYGTWDFVGTATPGPAATISLTSGNNQSGTVFTQLPSPFVVTITDAYLNATSTTHTVDFAFTSVPSGASGQSLTPPSTQTTSQASTTLTLGKISGTYQVTASSSGLAPATFTATANPGTATNILLTSGGGQSQTVKTQLANPFVVTVTDVFSNAVSTTHTVTFAIASTPSGATGQSLTPVSANTTSAQASTTLTLGTKSGLYTVTASSGNLTGATIIATAAAGVASKITSPSGTGQTGTVGTALLLPFTVLVTDIDDNPVSDGTVIDFSLGTYPPNSPPRTPYSAPSLSSYQATTLNGIASSTLTLGTITGDYTVTASKTGLTGSPQTFTGYAAPGALPLSMTLSINNSNGDMMTRLPDSLKLKLVDYYDNVMPSNTINFSFSAVPSNASSYLINPTSITTDGIGEAAVAVTLGSKAGTYTVTASLGTPYNITTSYSLTAKTFVIDGHIYYFSGQGPGVSGVTVACKNISTSTTTTDNNGYYKFTLDSLGSYTITPTKQSYSFTQPSITLSNVYTDQLNKNFVAKGIFTLTGSITSTGKPLPFIPVSLNGTTNTIPGIPISNNTTTDINGVYNFYYLPDGDYSIDPYQPNAAFTPSTPKVVTISNANTTQNFTAIISPFTISGNILFQQAALASDVKLSGDQTGIMNAGSDGYFEFIVSAFGNYTVTPALVGYRFTPPNINYTSVLRDYLSQTFTAYTVAELYPDKYTLDYEKVPINSTKPLVLKINNPGYKTLEITNLTITDTNASEFSIVPVILPISVLAGDSTTITVNFTPISPYSKGAKLEIESNAGIVVIPARQLSSNINLTTIPNKEQNNITVPLTITTINLTGIGKSPLINYSTNNIKNDSIGYLQPSIDSLITIHNYSDTAAVITSLYFSTQDTIFQILQQTPITISPYDSTKITLRYKANTVGAFTNILNIISDSYNFPSFQIPVQGKTVGSNITSPLTTDLGTTELLSSPKDTTINITNTGQYPLQINSISLYPLTSPLEITNNFPGTGLIIYPGESYPVTLRLKTREPYNDSIQLIITNNSSNNPTTTINIFGEVAKAKLSLTPTETDFGTTDITIPQITRTILAENLASQRLKITDKRIIGDIESFKLKDIYPQELEANGTSNLEIDFFPRSAGVKLCTLKVTYINPVNNVPSDLYIFMKGTGGGKPKLETNLGQIDFGNLRLNNYKDTNIAIKNIGNLDLKITGEIIGGTNRNLITLLSSRVPLILQMGETDTIKIRMSSDQPLGEKSATLQIATNDTNKTINLTGYIKSPIEATDINKIVWNEYYTGTAHDTILIIKNIGNDTLQITNILIDGGSFNDFTFPELLIFPFNLLPQTETTIKVRFNPMVSGPRFSRILISSNDPVNPELALPVRGLGKLGSPIMLLTIDTLNFQPIPFAESTTSIFTIKNVGTDSLRISEIGLTGINKENFEIQNITYPLKLPINSEKQITVKFTPTLNGNNYAQINIQSDDTTKGKNTIMLNGFCVGKASITVSTEMIDYGITEKGEIRDSIIIITNQGNSGLRIDSIRITGINRNDFMTEDVTYPFVLNPNATKKITIRYSSNSPLSVRSTGKLEIYTNDSTNIIRSVLLNGIMTTVKISATNIDFGKTSLDTTITERKIMITNNGSNKFEIKNLAITEDTISYIIKNITQNKTLSPGATDTTIITFNPRSIGIKTSKLIITTSDLITPIFTVNLSGEGGGKAVIFTATEKIDFGTVGIGKTKDSIITIRNDGNLELQLTEINITGKDKDIFIITDPGTTKTLQNGEKDTIIIRMIGNTQIGDKTAQLGISNNDNTKNPLNINLIGLIKSPIITLSINKINMDTVSLGDTSKADFTIKNSGNDTLTINNVTMEGENSNEYYLSGYQLPIKLLPEEMKSITVGYNPQTIGSSSIKLKIYSNDVNTPASQIEINGMGKKAGVIAVNPMKIEFQGVTIYRTKDTSIMITNEDIKSLWIRTIKLSGDTTQFEMPKIDSFRLEPNGTKNITIKYKPTKEGTSIGNIEIIPIDTIKNRTVKISVVGMCIVPVTKITVTSIDYSNLRITTTKDTIIKIENTGEGILEIRDITIKGDSTDFIIPKGNIEIQPKSQIQLKLSFFPKSIGEKNATINITTNDPKSAIINLTMKGRGTEPKINVSSTKVDMGKVFIIITRDTTLTLTNDGSDILNVQKIYITGKDSTRFTITGTDKKIPCTLNPNESIKVMIQYLAKSIGNKEAAINIESDDFTTAITKIIMLGEGTLPKIVLDGDLIAEENLSKTMNFHLNEKYSPKMIKIYYKHGNASTFDSVTIQPDVTNNNSYIFPKEDITKNGLDFYIKYIWDEVEVSLPDTNYKETPITYQILIKNYESVIQFYPKNYSMITVPLYFPNSTVISEIITNLGPYNSSTWRVFRLEGLEYKEYTNGDVDSDEKKLYPGNGFWLITNENKGLTFHSCLTVPTNNPFKISLKPGWNQIGNPFTFILPLSGMQIPDNKRVDRTLWSWSADKEYRMEGLYFEPWLGYYIRNNESDSVDILINPKSAASISKTTNKTTETKLNEREWKYQIGIKNVSNNLTANNNHTEFGCLTNSKENWDINDLGEPPPSPNGTKSIYSCIRFPHTEWEECKGNYIRDYREINKEGNTWELEIEKNNPFFNGQQYVLILNKEGELSKGNKILIYDYDNMRVNEYEINQMIEQKFNFSTEKGIKKLRIIVGTAKYVNEKRTEINKEVSQIPVKTYLLKQNYPNPFNPGTIIEYEIPKSEQVKIIIYNTLGQEVQTLLNKFQESGRYGIEWNPNEKPGGLPSGIYFYKLQSGNFTQIKKMLYIR